MIWFRTEGKCLVAIVLFLTSFGLQAKEQDKAATAADSKTPPVVVASSKEIALLQTLEKGLEEQKLEVMQSMSETTHALWEARERSLKTNAEIAAIQKQIGEKQKQMDALLSKDPDVAASLEKQKIIEKQILSINSELNDVKKKLYDMTANQAPKRAAEKNDLPAEAAIVETEK